MDENMELSTNNVTEVNKYVPSPAALELLEIKLNPDNLGKSVTDVCKIWGHSRTHFYELMGNSGFVELLNKTALDMVRDKVSDVLSASIKAATTGGVKGYQDRRMLLEMFGIAVKENDNRIVIVNIGE